MPEKILIAFLIRTALADPDFVTLASCQLGIPAGELDSVDAKMSKLIENHHLKGKAIHSFPESIWN
jgi:hypothetical protein